MSFSLLSARRFDVRFPDLKDTMQVQDEVQLNRDDDSTEATKRLDWQALSFQLDDSNNNCGVLPGNEKRRRAVWLDEDCCLLPCSPTEYVRCFYQLSVRQRRDNNNDDDDETRAAEERHYAFFQAETSTTNNSKALERLLVALADDDETVASFHLEARSRRRRPNSQGFDTLPLSTHSFGRLLLASPSRSSSSSSSNENNNSSTRVNLSMATLTAEQTALLFTTPHAMSVALNGCTLDGPTLQQVLADSSGSSMYSQQQQLQQEDTSTSTCLSISEPSITTAVDETCLYALLQNQHLRHLILSLSSSTNPWGPLATGLRHSPVRSLYLRLLPAKSSGANSSHAQQTALSAAWTRMWRSIAQRGALQQLQFFVSPGSSSLLPRRHWMDPIVAALDDDTSPCRLQSIRGLAFEAKDRELWARTVVPLLQRAQYQAQISQLVVSSSSANNKTTCLPALLGQALTNQNNTIQLQRMLVEQLVQSGHCFSN